MMPKRWAGVVAIVSLATLSVAATPVQASPPVTGVVIAELGLNLRDPARGADIVGDAVQAVPIGTTLEIFCVIPGERITGPYGSTDAWDAVSAYRTPDNVRHELGEDWLIATDAWVDTDGPTETMVPPCFGAVGPTSRAPDRSERAPLDASRAPVG